MRILHFIPDDQTRSKVLALAEARHLPPRRCEGPWLIFEADWDGVPVLEVLQAAGLEVPALAPVPTGAGARRPKRT
jgi:hypothetical protein